MVDAYFGILELRFFLLSGLLFGINFSVVLIHFKFKIINYKLFSFYDFKRGFGVLGPCSCDVGDDIQKSNRVGEPGRLRRVSRLIMSSFR